jgi:hypothetical protein
MESSLASSAAERTMNTSAAGETAASQQTMSLSTKMRHRKSVKQDRIEAKRLKTDDDDRYKAAFKEATSIVAS